MDYEKLVQKTVDLSSAGKTEESRKLVIEYLRDEPESIEALHLLTDLLENPEDKKTVLEQILKISPKNRSAHEKIKKIQLDIALNDAFEKAKEGNLTDALSTVDRVITEDMRVPAAWYLKARFSEDSKEVRDALFELEKLSTTHEDAKLYLDQLVTKKNPRDGKKRKIRTGYIFIIAAAVVMLMGICGVLFTLLFPNDDPVPTEVVFDDEIGTLEVVVETDTLFSCQEIIDNALILAEDVCSGLDSNQACYGNQTVLADFVPDFTGRFEMVGDLVALDKLTRIVASPLQYEEQVWGVAFLKLQANLPGTLPGQNVTFLVFGDTVLENNTQNMSTFYFTTGLTGITCEKVDYDGLLVRMPDGSGISFRSNGVDVILKGDAMLQAQPAGEMSVAMLSGSSELSSDGQTVNLNAGNYSTIPMGENLEPSGPISPPKPLTEELLEKICQILGIGCPDNPIPTVTPTATATPTQIPTATQVIQLPTNTKVPPATSTSPPPPTNTPNPGACSDIKISGSGDTYQITNNYGSDIIITRITLSWPVATNGNWKRTTLNGPAIHSKQVAVSPATAELFADIVKRTVPIGSSGTLVFYFANPPAPSGYSVTVGFNVGCTRSTSN